MFCCQDMAGPNFKMNEKKTTIENEITQFLSIIQMSKKNQKKKKQIFKHTK